MSELDEILEIVDENNNVIGKATRGECYKKGLLHRAVNIFIFNSKGELFLHKRSDKKVKYPGYWDLSCSEHVRVGESFIDAANRGLKEELGIEIAIEEILPIHRMNNTDENSTAHDNELVVTYKGIYKGTLKASLESDLSSSAYEGEMKFDPEEVSEGRFFDVKELEDLISNGQLKVTSWFLEDWKLLN